MLINFNGQFIAAENFHLAPDDQALLYGDSLFETLRAEKQQICAVREHLDRLCQAAQLLTIPCQRQALQNALNAVATRLTAPVSRLRLTLGNPGPKSAKTPNPWFLITAKEYSEITLAQRQAGAVCVLAPNRRSNPLDHLPQMKHGNYVDCLYAAAYARQQGAREALFVERGKIIEGNSSNIFARFGADLYTPAPGRLVLAGITRQNIIGQAKKMGLRVHEKALSLKQLLLADEIWLTNSLIGILPVASIAGQTVARGTQWEKWQPANKLQTEP